MRRLRVLSGLQIAAVGRIRRLRRIGNTSRLKLPQCLHLTPIRPPFQVAFFHNASYCFPVYIPKE